MLDNTSLETSAQLVWGKPTCYKAGEATPLRSVVANLLEKTLFNASATSTEEEERKEALDMNEVVNLISNVSAETGSGYDSFTPAIEELTKTLTDIVRNNIYVTRNVVLPLVDDYTELLNESVNEYAYAPNLALKIVTNSKNNILSNSTLRSLCSKHEDYLGKTETLSCQQDIGVQELETCLKTGTASLDKLLEEWYSSTPLQDVLIESFEVVFKQGSKRDLSEFLKPNKFEHAIFIFLLAQKFLKETPDGVDMSATHYELGLEKIIACSCRHIASAIRNHERNVEMKHLVLSYPANGVQYAYDKVHTGSNDIVVESSVYEAFLESGGTPNLIIGAYLSDKATKMSTILENISAYQRAYDRALSSGKLIKDNKVLTIVKTTLNNISKNILNDIKEKFEDKADDHGYTTMDINIDFLGRRVIEYTNNIRGSDTENLYTLVRDFIVSVYFDDSQVGDLLNRIDRIDPNGEMDVNDVAVIASVDMVTDWLTDQVVVGKDSEASY